MVTQFTTFSICIFLIYSFSSSFCSDVLSVFQSIVFTFAPFIQSSNPFSWAKFSPVITGRFYFHPFCFLFFLAFLCFFLKCSFCFCVCVGRGGGRGGWREDSRTSRKYYPRWQLLPDAAGSRQTAAALLCWGPARLSDTPQLKWDQQRKALVTPSRKLANSWTLKVPGRKDVLQACFHECV